jgi:hypothetical protein
MSDGLLGDASHVSTVAALEKLDLALARASLVQLAEVADVGPQLLDGAAPEAVACGDEYLEVVLEQPEADLG